MRALIESAINPNRFEDYVGNYHGRFRQEQSNMDAAL